MFWYPRPEDLTARDADGVTLTDFLRAYDPRKYELPAVAADNLIFLREGQSLKLLLIRRGRHPYYGMLALPGGFIGMQETLEQSAARELMEETGITGVKLTQLGAYGTPGKDPRMRIISVAYWAVLDGAVDFVAGDDAAEAAFYDITVSCEEADDTKKYKLRAKNGTSEAIATVFERGGGRTIAAGDLAADHALMILDALARIGSADNM